MIETGYMFSGEILKLINFVYNKYKVEERDIPSNLFFFDCLDEK